MAVERKQQKVVQNSGDQEDAAAIAAAQRARIEQNRLAALARKEQRAAESQQAQNPTGQETSDVQDMVAAQRARIEQNRLAAMARKQEKAEGQQPQSLGDQEVPGTQADSGRPAEESRQQHPGCDDAESSSAPSTPSLPSLSSAPSTPSVSGGSEKNLDGSCASDSSSDSESSSSDSSSSSNESSSGSSSSSDSDSSSAKQSPAASSLTAGQVAKIAQNRRAALARKQGLTPEQIEKMEQNRRMALARKRGMDPKQIARIEDNRRKALERKQQKQADADAAQTAVEANPQTAVAKDCSGVVRPKPVEERDARQKLVAQILCRWWFAMPPWPPEDLDTAGELARRGFRQTTMTTFDQEPELDERGFRKAYELEQFKGCFRTSDGELLDIRPIEGRPSWDQLMLKSTPDLYRLLIKAFNAQLVELTEESKKNGITKELDGHLDELKKQAAQVRQKAVFFLMMTGPSKN